MAETLKDEIEKTDDIGFAIPLKVSLVFAKQEGEEQIVIAKANGSAQDLQNLRNAMVVEKTVNPDKSHPYSQDGLMQAVNERLLVECDEKTLAKKLPKRNAQGKPALNRHCIQACVSKLNWKSGNNEYHYYSQLANRRQYSDAAVQMLVNKVVKYDDFVIQAKAKKR